MEIINKISDFLKGKKQIEKENQLIEDIIKIKKEIIELSNRVNYFTKYLKRLGQEVADEIEKIKTETK